MATACSPPGCLACGLPYEDWCDQCKDLYGE